MEDLHLPARLPCAEEPDVSVIVPTYGNLAYTLACLRSIERHGADAAFEVIVIDDASSEDTDVLDQIEGLRVLRNDTNLGFVGSCNAGARIASGRLLLFLNNDTQVTPGWLDSLLTCFADPACGIAGSKLVYPDGRLQEAGAIVYADGNAWNYGRFEDPADPRFRYVRDADYVSGAALMIDAALFRQIGGFDSRYAPAYCEDMDLAFAVRSANRRVIYQPASVVIHFEGVSSGLDPFSGVKQYQLINRKKFASKWADALTCYPSPTTAAERAVHHKSSRSILIVDALMPDPTRDSGSVRIVNMMRILRDLGYSVTFMAESYRATDAEIDLLGKIGVATLCKPWSPNLQQWLKQQGSYLSAAILCRHYVAEPHIELLRRFSPEAKIIFDSVDLHFLRESRGAQHTGSAIMARQAELSRRRELATINACDATLVVSQVELELLKQETPHKKIELVSNIHEIYGRRVDFQDRRNLVFVGGFGHPPNKDAVKWLTSEIFPLIREEIPGVVLHLIGDMPDEMQQLFTRDGVVAHGRVADLAPWMDGCRIALAPLRYGAGVKGKINMAMSYGLPVVATSMAAEGMALIDGTSVILGDSCQSFAAAVVRLYHDEALWHRLSDGALATIHQHFSFETATAGLKHVLDGLITQ